MEMDQPMNLDEAAQGIAQLNTDLQRNTDAYRYFTNTLTTLNKILVGEKLDVGERLPDIPFKFATTANAGAPGEYKLDMNSLPKDELAAFGPLFETLRGACAEDLLVSWERLIDLVNSARQIVQATRSDESPGE